MGQTAESPLRDRSTTAETDQGSLNIYVIGDNDLHVGGEFAGKIVKQLEKAMHGRSVVEWCSSKIIRVASERHNVDLLCP
jgi:hypothetical protein